MNAKPVTVRVAAARRGRQSGMTLLLTLGFLCVMLMLVLSLALASRTERRAAAAGADLVRSRLVAQSALGEAAARLRLDYAGVRYPADRFYVPTASSSWAGRRYLSTGGSSAVRADIGDALAVQLAGRTFTPNTTLSNNAGWAPMLSAQSLATSSGLVNQNTVVGRYAYLIIDQSGMIDPGAVVQLGLEEPTTPIVSGATVANLSLATLGFANANAFTPTSPGEQISGLLPLASSRWFDLSHMARAMNFTQSEMDLAARTLFPFSYDQEQFWRDRDNDSAYDAGEEADRLDVRAFGVLSQVYHTLVGPQQDPGHYLGSLLDAGDDDCQWLKDLDGNPWFTTWKSLAFAAYSEPGRTIRAREQVAAQIAANIADYADPDSIPTLAYLDNYGQIHVGTCGGTTNVAGVERTWGLSEISMRVETDATEVVAIAGTGAVTGSTPLTTDVPFSISAGQVVPQVNYQVTVTVLGADLSLHQGSDTGPLLWWCPVTTSLRIGTQAVEPWGPIADVASDIQDFDYPKHYQVPAVYAAGTPIVFSSKFWNHPYSDGAYDTKTWTCYRTVTSNTNPDQAKILRDGDAVPNLSWWWLYTSQPELAYFLLDYVEGSRISLQPNQAICLFESRTSTEGTRNYQDLVVLVTLSKAPPVQAATVLTRHAAAGTCNINPSNSSANEFYLTKPDGSQINRDDLLESRAQLRYDGICTRLHWRPKGNSNDNYVVVNGKQFECKNGTVYDFVGTMPVSLYNDKYDGNGRAMGHWWLGLAACAEIIITVDGVTYTEVLTPPTPPVPPLPTEPMAGGSGSDLRLRAGFKVELSYPWSADGNTVCPPAAVEVTYRVDVVTATGKTLTRYATKTVNVDQATVVDGGTLTWTGTYHMDDWVNLRGAFDDDDRPMLSNYTVTLARIERVIVKDSLGNVADAIPSPADVLYEAAATQAVSGDQVFHVGLTAVDPFMNDRGFRAPDFGQFWTTIPATPRTLDVGEASAPATFGQGTVFYQTGAYSGIAVPNSLIQRLGELGRVHSYQPSRSLRLWAASSMDENGSDAAILDVFKIGNQAQVAGRVNINTVQPEVLKALFTGALDVNVDSAVAAVLARRAAGTVFTNIGQIFGTVADITPSNSAQDRLGEEAAVRLAERITTRSNYFTVIVCAQAVRDVAGLVYKNEADQNVTAAYGTLDIAKGGRCVDPVLSEQKMMAVIYRDALTNVTRIERLEYLDE